MVTIDERFIEPGARFVSREEILAAKGHALEQLVRRCVWPREIKLRTYTSKIESAILLIQRTLDEEGGSFCYNDDGWSCRIGPDGPWISGDDLCEVVCRAVVLDEWDMYEDGYFTAEHNETYWAVVDGIA
jgi:hypothetical protein